MTVQHWFDSLSKLLFPADPTLARMARDYLTLDDLISIRDRMICTGSTSGKALGMLDAARGILRRQAPELHDQLEAHDSFTLQPKSSIPSFVRNGVWWIRRQQRDPHTFLHRLDEAQERIMRHLHRIDAAPARRDARLLRRMAVHRPLQFAAGRPSTATPCRAVRECFLRVNHAPYEQRLEELLNAIRQVYASSLSEKALRYRQRRGLLEAHEQMALLIMRVCQPPEAATSTRTPPASALVQSISLEPGRRYVAGVVRLVAGLVRAPSIGPTTITRA